MTNNPTEVNGAGKLLATLVTASFSQSTHITNQLIEAYRRGQYEAEARCELIRDDIETLLSGRYAPTERAISHALYPDERRVEAIANAQMQEDGHR